MKVGVVTEDFHVPLCQLCVYSHRYHCKTSFLVLYNHQEHRSWASTWLPVTAQPTNSTPDCSRTTDPDKALKEALTMGISVASGGSADHVHQRAPPHAMAAWPMDIRTSTWLQPTAQTTDISWPSVAAPAQTSPWPHTILFLTQ